MCFGGYVNGSRVNQVIMCKHEGTSFSARTLSDNCGPSARAGFSCGLSGKSVYMFGGQEDDNRKLNDVWSFNCDDNSWSQVKFEQNDFLPTPRSGHSTVVYGQKIFIFGGILELTKELNDLVVFDLKTGKFSSSDCSEEQSLKDDIEQSPDAIRSKDSSPMKKVKPLATIIRGGATANKIAEFLLKKSMTKKDHHEVEKVATARLSSPTSVSMRNTFIIKNADESFDYNSRLLPKGGKKAMSTLQDTKFTSLEAG